MRKLLSGWLLGASVALACGAGCTKTAAPPAEQAPAAIAAVSVDQLAAMLAANDCQAVDANGDPTRKRMGIIPGAVLLTSMDSLDGLPADKSKNLVFYCANTSCGASEYAAQKAMTAGYTHVKVLPEGIAGWVKAGKQTSSI